MTRVRGTYCALPTPVDEGTTERLPRVGSPQRIGRVLGSRYALYDDVGSGPLAHVYKAWDQQLTHRVAVKILDSRFLHQQIVDAFEGEAQRAASLPSHRCIASVHDVEREGQLPYIVMEYVPGGSVRSILAREAPLSVDHAFGICRQVAEGLAFAHEYGVVHGNIKPENILLSRNGQAKVTDFGIGHAMEIAETFGALPPVARAHYMSPEQALGRKPSPSSDVYSLGMVLFEMLTGTLPSQPGDFSSVMGEHAPGSPPHLQRLHPTIPSAVWRIVVRALARDPEGRYRTAGAFASALHQYLLLTAGSTLLDMPAPAAEDVFRDSESRPTKKVIPLPSKPSVAHPVRLEPGSANPRRLTVMSLVFVGALVVALVGGWFTYRAISDLLKQWGQPPGATAEWMLKGLQPAHTAFRTHTHVAVEPRTYRYVGDLEREIPSSEYPLPVS